MMGEEITFVVATIYVDGRAYQGEDPDAEYETHGAALGGSFHNRNGPRLSVLRFGDRALEIIGARNLASHMEKIMRRLGDRALTAKRIEIRLEERPFS